MRNTKSYYDRKMSTKSKITDLEPFKGKIHLLFKCIKKGHSKHIKKNGHTVCECLIADDTGSVLLTVWDEDIEMLEPGEYFEIFDGFVTIHNSKLKLKKMRYGEIEPCPEQDYDINLENNISDKKYDRTLTLLQTRGISPEALAGHFNIGQDNVKIIGIDN